MNGSTQKRRGGRPRIDAVPIMVRVAPDKVAALDAWRARQDDAPSRPEAIRRLVEIALRSEAR